MTTMSTDETLVACFSGAADPPARAALAALANAIRHDAPSVDVREISVDLLQPDDSWSPVRVAVPLALTAGTEISSILAIAHRNDPTIRVASPLGPDWAVAELCVQRLIEAGARKGDTIVLGVVGSNDDTAIDGYSRAAKLLSALWGGSVHIGSVAGRDTPLTDAVDIARAYGRRVVVASYLLTPGGVADVLRHCGADVVTAPLLDGGVPDPRLVSLVITRFHQALGAGVRI